jgi:flagellar biosynthesis/type III secretory pathway M-ring protein FliF/YscJ
MVSLELLLAGLLLVAVVALVVLRPLVDGPGEADDERERGRTERRQALEAAKEAKYREIRDAELDFRTGKLSEADYRKIDRELRAQAIEILRQIDELEDRAPEARP